MLFNDKQEHHIFQDDTYDCQKILRSRNCNKNCIEYGDLVLVHLQRLLQPPLEGPPVELNEALNLCSKLMVDVEKSKKAKKIENNQEK